jgi:hypothetical protein
MNKASHNIDDINFVLQRIRWFADKTSEEVFQYAQIHPDDLNHTINTPNGRRVICGAEATEKFYDIASRYFTSHPVEKQKVELYDFIKNLKLRFLESFVDNSREVNQGQVEKMIASAYKKTKGNFEVVTHYIPCNIFASRAISKFQIGSIIFLHEKEFELQYSDEIENLRKIIIEEQQRLWNEVSTQETQLENLRMAQLKADGLVDGLRSSWSDYEWIAIVKIDACSPTISAKKATLAVRNALNILKLLFGGRYTDRIRLGSEEMQPLKGAKLTRQDNGNLDISLSSMSRSKPIGDEWIERLEAEDTDALRISTQILELSIKFGKLPPLCERFLDALSWYGDAVAENLEAAKIIKFVSSIERITGTGIEKDEHGKERGVTEIVVSRASVLYRMASDHTLEESVRKVKHIYDQRSGLVHGSLSQYDEVCIKDSFEAEKIARYILFSGLYFFDDLGLENMEMTQRKLRSAYNNIENMYCI